MAVTKYGRETDILVTFFDVFMAAALPPLCDEVVNNDAMFSLISELT